MSKSIRKHIKRLPNKDQERILEVLRSFRVDPWSGDIEKIGGREDLWRRRVGNYRVFYSIQGQQKRVEVKQVERRTSSTY